MPDVLELLVCPGGGVKTSAFSFGFISYNGSSNEKVSLAKVVQNVRNYRNSSVVRAARIWLGFEPDRKSQTVSGSARQLLDDEPIVQLGLCQVF